MTDTKHSADVYAEIMQLPATPPDDIKDKGIFVYYYQRGYREARHAAAELAKSCAAIAAAAPKVALTDKQIIDKAKEFGELWGNSDDNWIIDFAKAIEAASGPNAALAGEKTIPLSVLEEIAQEHADAYPGPGGFPCTPSEKEAIKKQFLKRWMAKAGVKP